MRLYFHLLNGQRSIPDSDGIDVSDVNQVQVSTLETLQDLRRETRSPPEDWSGWTLRVMDAAGAVVVTIDLNSLVG